MIFTDRVFAEYDDLIIKKTSVQLAKNCFHLGIIAKASMNSYWGEAVHMSRVCSRTFTAHVLTNTH